MALGAAVTYEARWRRGASNVMGTITLYEVVLTKEQLERIPNDELNWLLLSGVIANEISMLQKLLIFSAREEVASEVEQLASNAQVLFLNRLLAGKLTEAKEIISKKYHGNGISQKYDADMPEWARKAGRELNRYFGKQNLLQQLRTGYAFHYPTEDLTQVLDLLDKDEKLRIFLAEAVGNSFYHISDSIMTLHFLDKVIQGKLDQLPSTLEALKEELLSVAERLMEFISGFMIVFFSRHLGQDLSTLKASPMAVDAPAISGIRAPYFVSRE